VAAAAADVTFVDVVPTEGAAATGLIFVTFIEAGRGLAGGMILSLSTSSKGGIKSSFNSRNDLYHKHAITVDHITVITKGSHRNWGYHWSDVIINASHNTTATEY
jgi:hypothetical protein